MRSVPGRVEQRDTSPHDPDRAPVRVAPRDRLRRVDDRGDAGLDQAVGGDAIEVDVVDHRDVAGHEPPDHVFRAPVDLHRTHHLGGRSGTAAAHPEHQRVPALVPAGARLARLRQQLGGVAAGVRRLADPGEHPRQLGDAGIAVDDRGGGHGPFAPGCPIRRLLDHGLLHHDLHVGKCRHLREMRDTQHLVLGTQCREQASDGNTGLASDARVDFVEHQRRGRVRQDNARRQHRTRELSAGRGPGQRAGAFARIGGKEEGHPVDAVLGGLSRFDLHVHARVRHRELPEVPLHRPREGLGGAVPGRRQAADASDAARSCSPRSASSSAARAS